MNCLILEIELADGGSVGNRRGELSQAFFRALCILRHIIAA